MMMYILNFNIFEHILECKRKGEIILMEQWKMAE